MRLLLPFLFCALLAAGCDHGLAPPDDPPFGAILSVISYEGTWPSADSLQDLRFVAMRFVPRDTADFLQLNRLVFSKNSLDLYVERDTVLIEQAPVGVFVYSGVAQNYSSNLFAWRPVGIYEEGDGIFQVRSGDTTRLSIHVNFAKLPPFPP